MLSEQASVLEGRSLLPKPLSNGITLCMNEHETSELGTTLLKEFEVMTQDRQGIKSYKKVEYPVYELLPDGSRSPQHVLVYHEDKPVAYLALTGFTSFNEDTLELITATLKNKGYNFGKTDLYCIALPEDTAHLEIRYGQKHIRLSPGGMVYDLSAPNTNPVMPLMFSETRIQNQPANNSLIPDIMGNRDSISTAASNGFIIGSQTILIQTRSEAVMLLT
jgi:hypothetical protein